MTLYHMAGAGNDFIVLDARGLTQDLSCLARTLCKQYGTDGFLALDTSQTADFRMHFYNPDGSRGEMCGNGARCLCKLACDLDVAGPEITMQTDAGPVYGRRLAENRFQVQLNAPGVVDLRRKEHAAYIELGDPGIPHCVTHLPGLTFSQKEHLRPLAKSLRYDPVFPKGVNVNFYHWLDENTVRILTYERGVENYTQACGTGSGSVAAVLWLTGQLPGGVLKLDNPGGTLTVTVSGSASRVETLLLEGPASYIQIYEL